MISTDAPLQRPIDMNSRLQMPACSLPSENAQLFHQLVSGLQGTSPIWLFWIRCYVKCVLQNCWSRWPLSMSAQFRVERPIETTPIRLKLSCSLPVLLVPLLAVLVGGCATPTRRAEQLAERHGLEVMTIPGTEFRHEAFARPDRASDMLWIFIEGDGSPYTNGGRSVSPDPSPHDPLALKLAIGSPGAVLYLGRPCYFSRRLDAGCSPVYWTTRRYSPEVVASMVAAVERYRAGRYGSLVLVGYSGGGTLAVLMARQMHDQPAAVITLAANLDTESWTRWHHYLALENSLDPAALDMTQTVAPQWHLVGDRDVNVPPQLNQRYFARFPPNHVWHYASFSHNCCWAKQWPAIRVRLLAAFAAEAPYRSSNR
jgi:pimeloyl-ACP methyl ester carboxylesterase